MAHEPIWLFDGHCVLCSRAVAYALAHEREGTRMWFVEIGSRQGRAFARQYGVDPDDPHSFVFLERGTPHVASDGVIALARHLRGPAGWIAPLGRVMPKRWRDRLYHWVARNRYRLWGRNNECLVPAPQDRDRFVLGQD